MLKCRLTHFLAPYNYSHTHTHTYTHTHIHATVRTEVNTQPPTILTGRDTSGQPITFTGTIYIPLAQPIAYQPGIAEVLKMSWIQYISLFFLVAVFVVPAYEFMVRMGVVSTWSTTDRIPPDYSSVGGGVGFKPHHY